MNYKTSKKTNKAITELMKSHLDQISGGFYQVCLPEFDCDDENLK